MSGHNIQVQDYFVLPVLNIYIYIESFPQEGMDSFTSEGAGVFNSVLENAPYQLHVIPSSFTLQQFPNLNSHCACHHWSHSPNPNLYSFKSKLGSGCLCLTMRHGFEMSCQARLGSFHTVDLPLYQTRPHSSRLKSQLHSDRSSAV